MRKRRLCSLMPQLSKHGVQGIVNKMVGVMSIAEQLRSVPAVPPYRERVCDTQLREIVKDAEREQSRTRAWHLVPAKAEVGR